MRAGGSNGKSMARNAMGDDTPLNRDGRITTLLPELPNSCYRLQTKFWGKVIFSQVSVHRRKSLYDATSCLVAWSHVPSKGVSVSGRMFLRGRGVSFQGVSVREAHLGQRPPCTVKSGWYAP